MYRLHQKVAQLLKYTHASRLKILKYGVFLNELRSLEFNVIYLDKNLSRLIIMSRVEFIGDIGVCRKEQFIMSNLEK